MCVRYMWGIESVRPVPSPEPLPPHTHMRGMHVRSRRITQAHTRARDPHTYLAKIRQPLLLLHGGGRHHPQPHQPATATANATAASPAPSPGRRRCSSRCCRAHCRCWWPQHECRALLACRQPDDDRHRQEQQQGRRRAGRPAAAHLFLCAWVCDPEALGGVEARWGVLLLLLLS